MQILLAVATKGQFAERLGDSLWMAYGPLVKAVGYLLLVIFVVLPLLAWVRRVLK